MKNTILFILFCVSFWCQGQVGINTTDPNAQLEIKSSNQLTPSNTDGLLIPKIDAFPTANPTFAQQGMLVYLNTTIGTNQPGFYYWDNPTTSWLPIRGNNGVTLDQAYDFGGAGNGKTITADAGAVLINGTDGLVSTGAGGSGAIAPSGAGTRMVWNPNKAAFRAGTIFGTQWDDENIGRASVAFGSSTSAPGQQSTAFGIQSTASGLTSTAFGQNTMASGPVSMAFGASATASGGFSTAFGGSTTASGVFSTAFGDSNTASGTNSTAFGKQNFSPSFGETTFGIGATPYNPSLNGDTQFRAANAFDRLFVIGNAIDSNNNFTVDLAERRDALIILKNGLTRLPSTTNAMIAAADGKAVVTKEYLQSTSSGTLDEAYDFGGAGAGRIITADAGAVLINGTDGLVSTGISGSGVIVPSGSGVRMVWNPRKAAFRVGQVVGSTWDDANVGDNSIAMGFGNRAVGASSIALGSNSSASGLGSVAIGWGANANATQSTAFGLGTNANNLYSTTFGYQTIASGQASTSFGIGNEAESFGEVVLGIGATSYTPSSNAANQFRAVNATDRLFVVGNAIDANNNSSVDTAERSDAMIVLKNGLTRLPSTTNAMITAADGKAIVTKEYLQGNNWNLIGNSGTNSTTNFIGTIDNVDVIFKRNNIRAGLLGLGNLSFGLNALNPANTGNSNSAFGNGALQANTSGMNNTAVGRSALQSNTIGTQNTAVGLLALQSNSSGLDNTAIGNLSLVENTTGNFNTSAGSFSLSSNTTGSNNTASGLSALSSNTTGNNNTAIGSRSLSANTTGINNTANGYQSLFENTTGNNNVATGYQALLENTTGINNTAIGVLALDSNTTGDDNVAIGRGTLVDNITGNSNTAIGKDALFNSTSDNNTAVGRGTLSGVTTGSNNTGLGSEAQVANPANSNQVRIGSTAVTLVSAQVALTTTSDSRWKSNIQKSNLGLDFIKQLNPVSYTRKDVAINDGKTAILETTSNPSIEYGFIAQELENTLNKFDTSNNGIISKDDAGMYGVRYNDLIAPMVKAIQEQQAIIDKQKEENNSLKIRLDAQTKINEDILNRLQKMEAKN